MLEVLTDYATQYAQLGQGFELDPLPFDLQAVWDWFNDLLKTRQVGMGDDPLTYQEIEAYSRMTRTAVDPWEAKALVDMFWAWRGAKGSRASTAAPANDVDAVKGVTSSVGKKRKVVRKGANA